LEKLTAVTQTFFAINALTRLVKVSTGEIAVGREQM